MTTPANSREEARLLGVPTYYGPECVHGHGKVRYTASRSCKICKAERQRRARKENPKKYAGYRENAKIYQAEYYRNDRERLLRAEAKYRKNNSLKRAKTKAAWVKKNRAYCTSITAKRRADIALRTPSWLTVGDYAKIERIYEDARRLSLKTGVEHQVDHIVPIKGKLVSGLHVPSNLQILTAAQNRAKKNQYAA